MKLRPKEEKRVIRCAIYARKSTEEGLEQDYNSLDAQRDSGESFIKSLASEGWVCLPAFYDDGGFTGANMDRPALKRLIADIEAGLIDCVVVYKVDRLSRSLLDFGKLMELFDKHGVATRTSATIPRSLRSTASTSARGSCGTSSILYLRGRTLWAPSSSRSTAGRKVLLTNTSVRTTPPTCGT